MKTNRVHCLQLWHKCVKKKERAGTREEVISPLLLVLYSEVDNILVDTSKLSSCFI